MACVAKVAATFENSRTANLEGNWKSQILCFHSLASENEFQLSNGLTREFFGIINYFDFLPSSTLLRLHCSCLKLKHFPF